MGGPQAEGGAGGEGDPGKTAQLRSSSAGRALPVPAGPEPGTGLPEAESPRGGGGAGGKEGRDTGHEKEEPLTPPSQGERLMAGTVTTRKHARTHAHSTRPDEARARKPANSAPPEPSSRPRRERSLDETAPPPPCRSTHAHSPLRALWTSHHFPPTQPSRACALLVLRDCSVFPALHWPLEESQSSRPSLGIPARN